MSWIPVNGEAGPSQATMRFCRLAVFSVVSPKSVGFRCAQIGPWPGARRAHAPKWGCNRRATQPQPNFSATRRAAALFPADFVAHSLQIHFRICASLAPRLREKLLAAKAHEFRDTTRGRRNLTQRSQRPLSKGQKGNLAKTGCESPGTFAKFRHCFRFHPDVIPAFSKSKIRNEGLRRRGSVCHPKVRGTTIHLR